MRQRDLRLDNNRGHVDFPKLKRGDIGAVFFALYTSATLSPDEATKAALEMAAGVFDAVASSDTAEMAYSTDDILANRDKGKVSILLGMENGAPIQHSLPLLRLFYRLGVRVNRMISVGDERDTIISSLRNELRDNDIVIVTGGLGPTKEVHGTV